MRAVRVLLTPLVVLVGVHRLGRGPLDPPRPSWAEVTRWYAAVGPDVAVVAVVRGVALLLTGWLLVAGGLQVVAALPTLHPLRPVADAISPRSLQRLGRGLAGLSLTAGLAAPAPSAGTLAPDPSSAAVALAPDQEPPPTTRGEGAGTATMHLVEDDAHPAPTGVPAPGRRVTVAPGDSFWSIAVDVLAASGEAPGERQVAPYWRRLVEQNRGVLVDPRNPDLLYPGQVLELPAG